MTISALNVSIRHRASAGIQSAIATWDRTDRVAMRILKEDFDRTILIDRLHPGGHQLAQHLSGRTVQAIAGHLTEDVWRQHGH